MTGACCSQEDNLALGEVPVAHRNLFLLHEECLFKTTKKGRVQVDHTDLPNLVILA